MGPSVQGEATGWEGSSGGGRCSTQSLFLASVVLSVAVSDTLSAYPHLV